ncbi:ankyrin repeat domain-containing protein [Allofrancisella guangzhouensis]|nr:ankyrin repeat domain-containing protein [Allofrancisella guangzhouensis]
MWGQAILADDVVTFYERLQILTSETMPQMSFNGKEYNKLTDLINHVYLFEKELSKHKSVGQANLYLNLGNSKITYELIISIRAFLDGLLAYHKPSNTFLNNDYKIANQNILKTSPYVVNSELTHSVSKVYNKNLNITHTENSSLLQVYNQPFYGKVSDYTDVFNSLITKCIESGLHFYFFLNNVNHAVAISHDGANLLFYDANLMQQNSFKANIILNANDSYRKLVGEIFDAFRFSSNHFQTLALNISIYMNPKCPQNYSSVIYRNEYERLQLQNIKKYSCNLILNNKNGIYHSHKIVDKLKSFTNVSDMLSYIKKGNFLVVDEQKLNNNDYNNFAKKLDEKPEYYNIIHEIIKYTEKTFKEYVSLESYKPYLIETITKITSWKDSELLYVACQGGHTDVVNLLLQNNANPNQLTPDGSSPLHVACEHGYTDIVNLLLQNNVNPNQPKTDKSSPLYIACEQGYTEIVNLLLQNNANPNKLKTDGSSPLYIACEQGYAEIVNLLLTHNANPNKLKTDGSSPLYIACQNGYVEIVELLLQRPRLNNTTEMISQYFIGGCDKLSNNKVLESLKKSFPIYNINTVWDMPIDSTKTEPLTPLIQGCYFMNNRSISWLLNNYSSSLSNSVRFKNKDALEWYQTHQFKEGYDKNIEQQLRSLTQI